MKITANGISMNYTLDGPASAPVVTLSPRWPRISPCGTRR